MEYSCLSIHAIRAAHSLSKIMGAIASYAEMDEGMMEDSAAMVAKERLERMKAKTAEAMKRLADLMDWRRYKMAVERKRKQIMRSRGSRRECMAFPEIQAQMTGASEH